MIAFARFCSDHRRIVLAAWIVALIAAFGGWQAGGSHYSSNFTLGNTDAQKAADLLQSRFPSQSGDRDQIVMYAPGGIAEVATKARISAMLGKVSQLPNVSQVISPFASTGQISKDGKTAFAVVLFDQKANQIPTGSIKKVISTAQAARAPGLRVELGGQAIQQTEVAPPGSLTGIGVLAAVI